MTVAEAEKENSVKQKQVRPLTNISTYTELHSYYIATRLLML